MFTTLRETGKGVSMGTGLRLDMYYYEFSLISSRETDETLIRFYRAKPSEDQLKEDLEKWCSKFGAWQVSENACSYSFRQIQKSELPEGRREALAWHDIACKKFREAKNRRRFIEKLLAVAPFSGEKICANSSGVEQRSFKPCVIGSIPI